MILMKKIKIDGMLLATLLTTIFYSSTYPYIHKMIVSNVPDSFIAMNQILNCLSIIIFGSIWNKKSDTLFKYYHVFCIIETILTTSTTLWAIQTGDIIAYYVIDNIVFSVVTRNIICGGVKLRAIRYNSEKEREQFDNNNNSASAIATIVGSVIAMGLDLDFNTMLCIATFGNCIDNIFYIVIFKNTQKRRKSDYKMKEKDV